VIWADSFDRTAGTLYLPRSEKGKFKLFDIMSNQVPLNTDGPTLALPCTFEPVFLVVKGVEEKTLAELFSRSEFK